MAISDKLKQLQTEGQPQTLDELFRSSKEGMMIDKVRTAINSMLPALKESITNEVRASLAVEIQQQVSAIQVKDGEDGKTPDINEIVSKVFRLIPVPKNGEDGKDAVINKDEIVNEVLQRVPRGKSGGGGSTMRVDNLSSQVTGATRSFTATYKIGASHLLFYSSFPTLFLPTTDYTVSGNVVTLDSGIDFPVAGQSLAIIYEDGT